LIEQCDIEIKEHTKSKHQTAVYTSMAIKGAYNNVKKIITNKKNEKY
jgi:hypothetical protein